MHSAPIAFVGGGHMASALIGGLIAGGRDARSVWVVEPAAVQRDRLQARWSVRTLAHAGAELAAAGLVVWAVKPQVFADAAAPCAAHVTGALHLSVMAGIRTDALVRATGSPRVVRAMPNTPALIGQGIAGLYARPQVDADGRAWVEQLLAPTGSTLWVEQEADLDAVTALSGSGPAYVFYLLEAMTDAALQMGLSAGQGRALAQATVAGAAALAAQSGESPATLREQVTSKGGTTHAAMALMQQAGVGPAIVRAILAARQRARELGDEFGG
jgi:pyrroline-5-carboxylate reductase